MSLEQTLSDDLATVVRTLDVPPAPDAAALVAHAQRTRTRARVRWVSTTFLAAAAVIAAILAGTQIGRPGATPRPAHPSPTRTAEQLAVGDPLATYVGPDDQVLYIRGVAEPGTWGGASTVADLTIAVSNDLSTVGIFVDGTRVGTLHHVRDGEVMASPDGRTVGWMESSGGSAHLVAATVTPSGVHELGRLALDPAVVMQDSEGSERVMKVDEDHTITYGGVTSGHSWKPGQAPKVADVSVLLTRAPGFPNTQEPPDLNPAGSWGAWRSTSTGRSPHDEDTPRVAVTVQQPNEPGTRFTFAMPHGAEVQWVYWETDVELIAAVSGKTKVGGDYVRCSVVERTCEYAPTPGQG